MDTTTRITGVAGEPSSAAEADRPSTVTPSGRALTRRGATTQQRLVQTAWEVFSEKSYHDARITEITARAGTSTGSFYTYFESKEELFRTIAHQALAALNAAPALAADDDTGRTAVERIAESSRRFFLECSRHRNILRSIELLHHQDHQLHLDRQSNLVRNAKRVERWIRRLQQDGTCDPALDPWRTATALQAMNITLAYENLVHSDEGDRIDALVETITIIWARTVGLDPWV